MVVRLKGHPPLIDLPGTWHVPEHLLHVDVLVPATHSTVAASGYVLYVPAWQLWELSSSILHQHTYTGEHDMKMPRRSACPEPLKMECAVSACDPVETPTQDWWIAPLVCSALQLRWSLLAWAAGVGRRPCTFRAGIVCEIQQGRCMGQVAHQSWSTRGRRETARSQTLRAWLMKRWRISISAYLSQVVALVYETSRARSQTLRARRKSFCPSSHCAYCTTFPASGKHVLYVPWHSLAHLHMGVFSVERSKRPRQCHGMAWAHDLLNRLYKAAQLSGLIQTQHTAPREPALPADVFDSATMWSSW